MWLEFLILSIFGLLFATITVLASKNGSKAAQLEAIKAEIKRQAKERERAEKIANSIDNMDDTTVRQQLCKIASKR